MRYDRREPTVFYDQKIGLFRAVIEAVGGRVPIIANAGDNCTDDSVEFAARSSRSAWTRSWRWSPYYNKPPQEGLYRHFGAIAKRSMCR